MFTILLLFATTLFSLNALGITAAGPLDMEYSHKWAHDAVNAYDIYAADVDGDGVVEIVTIGWIWVDSTSQYSAQLRIYSWDGSALALLDTRTWTGSYTYSYAVASGDLNNNGHNEVVSVGYYYDGTDQYAELNVWSWNGGLNLEDRERWADLVGESGNTAVDVAVGQLDGQMMIAVAEYFTDTGDSKRKARLTLWSYGSSLTQEESVTWEATGPNPCYGVFVDADDNLVYTVGYANDGTNSEGQLRAWGYGSLTLLDTVEWLFDTYTYAKEVYVVDVDGDGEKEVIVIGEGTDGTRTNAILYIWNFGFAFNSKDSENWYSIDHTRAEAVYVADVDGDGVPEILTSGSADSFGAGQVTIWSYPDNTDPTITNFIPSSGSEVSNLKPTISATLSDDFSGIDVNGVTLEIDGVDVTSGATITVTGISYTPSSDLSEGDIVVTVEVSDKSGNTETATWTFTVKPPAPGIPGFPFESIMVGLMVAAAALYLLRKKTVLRVPVAPSI